MVGRAFCVKIIFDLHAVTCPGVWLCPKGKVALKIHIFESCVSTHRLTPIFPLLYHNKFTFKKVFSGVSTLAELEKKLSKENIFIEMIQWTPIADRNICLATFETNLLDLLYPAPCFKGLIAGVDVDLLMEPSKYFPGILSPKIEVSTKTTIEEISYFDNHPAEVRVINPKTINSMNQQCIHKRKEPSPVRRVPQQKKVCHLNGKSNAYLCRLCRRQKNNISLHNCNPSEENLLSSKNQCYHNLTQRRQICSHSSSPKKSLDNCNMCNDDHTLDSCPICLKYKCYFSNKRSESNSLTKLNDVTNYQNLLKCSESKSSVSNKVNCKCNDTCENSRDSATCKLCSDLNSLNLHNSTQKKRYQTHNENFNKYSLDRCRSSLLHRSNSEPSLNDDETTSILLAKIRQLERTKERLNYSNCHDGDSYNSPSCDVHEHQNSEVRKGFYKNLQKFYKRMYKQAKHRANDC